MVEQDPSRSVKEKLATPVFLTILGTTLCTFLVGQGTNAGTSVYLERTGGDIWLAGIGALCFSLAAAVARLIAGPLVDARGRRLLIISGALLMLTGCLLPILSNTGAWFVLWRLLQGAGFSAATTALATAAADVLPTARLGEGIGYYGLGQAISMSVGPALAIMLVSTDPPTNFYLGCAACSALALLLGCLIRYERDPSTLPATSEYRMHAEHADEGAHAAERTIEDEADTCTRDGHPLRALLMRVFEPQALHGAIPIAFMCAMFSFNIFYIGVFGSSIGAVNPGLFYTVSAVLMIAVRLVSGRFMDRTRPIRIMGVAVACGLAAFGMLLAADALAHAEASHVLFYAAGVPFGVSMGLAIPVNQTVAVRMSPPERWGAANGLFQLAIDIANGALSLVWGFLAATVGFGAVIICVMVLVGCGMLAALRLYPSSTD